MEKFSQKSLQNSRILITGGLGFVGAAIAKRLLREGVGGIVLFDMREELPEILINEKGKERLEIIPGDIRNPEHVTQAVAGCDYIFHEAGLRVTRCAKEPRLAHEILVDGTFNVTLACIEKNVKKLIHASSAIVYGEPRRLPLDEDHPTHDTTLYGICKVANENLLRSFRKQYGLDYIALRYFNIYGPGMNLFGPEVEVLIRWLDRIDDGLSPLIFGDGKQTLDYIFIDDVVEANWKALISGQSGEVFNVCTGRETSILKLLELLLATRGSNLQPEFREGRSVNQVARRFGCPEKAKKRLGFAAKIPLEQGLRELVDWRDRILVRKAPKSVEPRFS
jgi:UDP-glucose 4-epimerase